MRAGGRSVFLLVLLTALVQHVVLLRLEDWHCGSDEDQKKFAYDLVRKDCPQTALLLNHCCVIHDDCYVKQLGQAKCDEEFCTCNERAINMTAGDECRLSNTIACLGLPFFGVSPYENSLNWTEPIDLVKYRPSGVLTLPYDMLYAACSDINGTVSSCALNWEECTMSADSSRNSCVDRFANCVEDAGNYSDRSSCKREAHLMSQFILEEMKVKFNIDDPASFVVLKNSLMFLLCILGLAFITWSIMVCQKRPKSSSNTSSMDNIKYSNV